MSLQPDFNSRDVALSGPIVAGHVAAASARPPTLVLPATHKACISQALLRLKVRHYSRFSAGACADQSTGSWDEIRLRCSILGSRVAVVFMVDILPSKIVDLKNLVKEEMSSDVNVDRFVIWKVIQSHHH